MPCLPHNKKKKIEMRSFMIVNVAGAITLLFFPKSPLIKIYFTSRINLINLCNQQIPIYTLQKVALLYPRESVCNVLERNKT